MDLYSRTTIELCKQVAITNTLAWATGTHVGAGDHAIALFCIGCGRVLGFLYSDKLHFEVLMCALLNVLLYMWL